MVAMVAMPTAQHDLYPHARPCPTHHNGRTRRPAPRCRRYFEVAQVKTAHLPPRQVLPTAAGPLSLLLVLLLLLLRPTIDIKHLSLNKSSEKNRQWVPSKTPQSSAAGWKMKVVVLVLVMVAMMRVLMMAAVAEMIVIQWRRQSCPHLGMASNKVNTPLFLLLHTRPSQTRSSPHTAAQVVAPEATAAAATTAAATPPMLVRMTMGVTLRRRLLMRGMAMVGEANGAHSALFILSHPRPTDTTQQLRVHTAGVACSFVSTSGGPRSRCS